MNKYRITRDIITDRDTCLNWLREQELIPPKEKKCYQCQRDMTHESDHGAIGRFRCRINHRNRGPINISAAKGTWFENVKLPPEQVILLVFAFAHKYDYEETITQCSIRNTNLSRATVADWSSYCREVCMCALDDKYEAEGRIGGPGGTVEIDEAKVGKRKFNRGRPREGNWILGMIDREGGYRLEICPDNRRDRETLFPLIKKHVAPGTEIMTDCWAAYRGLEQEGYTHKTVNHSTRGRGRFVNPQTGAHTQRIEGSWKHLKHDLIDRGYKQGRLGDAPVHIPVAQRC